MPPLHEAKICEMQGFSGQTAVWLVSYDACMLVVYIYHAAKCHAAVEQP